MEKHDKDSLKDFVGVIARSYNLKHIKNKDRKVVRELGQHLRQIKLTNFLDAEDVQMENILGSDSWEDANQKLKKLDDYIDEEKLEDEFSRLLK